MITGVIVTNLLVVKSFYSVGLASSLVLGCHWFRKAADRLEKSGKA